MFRTVSWMMCAGAIAMGCGGLERAALRREAMRTRSSAQVVIDSQMTRSKLISEQYDLSCTTERCEAMLLPLLGRKVTTAAPLSSALFADSLEIRVNDATTITLGNDGDFITQKTLAKRLLTAQRASQTELKL